jgi:hypothetical protein
MPELEINYLLFTVYCLLNSLFSPENIKIVVHYYPALKLPRNISFKTFDDFFCYLCNEEDLDPAKQWRFDQILNDTTTFSFSF